MSENLLGPSEDGLDRDFEQQFDVHRKAVGDVAHDLNNSLLLITGYAELLSKNLDNRDQVITIVNSIQFATSRLRELSRKLQSLAQVEDAEAKFELVTDEEIDKPNVFRPSDVNIAVFVFDGELKQVVSRILEKEGFGVGEIVVERIGMSTNRDSNESVDLIVADVDIFKVARVRVRQLLRKYPRVPLLLLTNVGDDQIPTVAAAGGSSSLSKAFRPSELVAEVNRIFAQRNA